MPDTTVVKNALLQLDRRAAESWHLFEPLLQEVHVNSGAYLAHAGRISTAVYFITTGIVRVFTTNADKEVCLDFAFSGQFSTAYASFITQQPSAVTLEAVMPVTGFVFYYDDLQKLYDSHPSTERTGRLLAEYQYLRKYQRELSLLQYSAQERYVQLLEQHPQIIQHIPVKHIASYLGIEPESLSRIRKNLKQ